MFGYVAALASQARAAEDRGECDGLPDQADNDSEGNDPPRTAAVPGPNLLLKARSRWVHAFLSRPPAIQRAQRVAARGGIWAVMRLQDIHGAAGRQDGTPPGACPACRNDCVHGVARAGAALQENSQGRVLHY